MANKAPASPSARNLYFASLIATGMVYFAGAIIFTAFSYLGTQTGGWRSVLVTGLGFATLGVMVAAFLAFTIIAPLGTAFASAIIRVFPPSWWQGPLTGALVAVSLEAFVIVVVSRETLHWEMGNAMMLAIPIVLSMMAGGYVQQRVLRWPHGQQI